MASQSRILIIVENLTVPLDRRVWQEACALRDAGHTVSVICPTGGAYTERYELLDGIHVFRHPLPLEADGALGYAVEYSSALFWETLLSFNVRARVGFDVIQACNPPDTIFLLARLWRLLAGTRFVFDHHDINPELYEAKFNKRGVFHKLLLWLERRTFRAADVSIATNETFRRIAIERGGMDPSRVFVVRSLPDRNRFRRIAADPSLKRGRRHLIGYVGIMGAQDGVDLLVKAVADLVHRRGRTDVHCAIVGSGTELEKLQLLARELKVDDHVTFTGFLSGEPLQRAFSTFDVGVIPDPKNTYNDKIAMNKVFEYMAIGVPFVAFDLDETRGTAAGSALYAENNCPRSLADRIGMIIDHPPLAERLAAEGMARSQALLRWDLERDELLKAYQVALAPASSKDLPLPAARTLQPSLGR